MISLMNGRILGRQLSKSNSVETVVEEVVDVERREGVSCRDEDVDCSVDSVPEWGLLKLYIIFQAGGGGTMC